MLSAALLEENVHHPTLPAALVLKWLMLLFQADNVPPGTELPAPSRGEPSPFMDFNYEKDLQDPLG